MILAQRIVCAVAVIVMNACAAGTPISAQKVHRIAYLSGTSLAETTTSIEPLRQALRELGYVEGTDLTVEIRAAEGNVDRSPALAAELVATKPDLILVRGVPQALALEAATKTIPIVAVAVRDPVELGVVASVSRPGGNVTGLMSTGAESCPRRLQLLKEVVTGTSRVAWLYEPSNPATVRCYDLGKTAAATLGVELQPVATRVPEDLADGLTTAARGHPDAMYVTASALTISQRPRIVDFLAANRLPAITGTSRTFVDSGALLYYEANEAEIFRRTAVYVDRILKGTRPGDLPFESPSKYDLIVNVKTADAIGVKIPPSILAQATEVIR